MSRFSNILFVAAPDRWSREAYHSALKLAAGNNARLTVLDVLEESPHMPSARGGNTAPELRSAAVVERTERLKQLIVERRGVAVEIHVAWGHPLDEIIHQVVQNGHDLVIVADPKRETLRGCAAVQLVRKCPCSVWFINSDPRRPYRRVMAAVDADPYDAERDVLNARILRTAASIARVERSELHIAHAWMAVGEGILRGRGGFIPEEVGKYVDSVLHERTEAIDSLMKRSNVRALKRRVHLAKGPAGRVIPAVVASKEADLLVMGTLNRRGLARWFLANTAEEVLRRVGCDVLIIKPDRSAIPERLKPRSIRPAAAGSPPVAGRKEVFNEKYGFG